MKKKKVFTPKLLRLFQEAEKKGNISSFHKASVVLTAYVTIKKPVTDEREKKMRGGEGDAGGFPRTSGNGSKVH